jgi:membrane associated rhomboid family serine protease
VEEQLARLMRHPVVTFAMAALMALTTLLAVATDGLEGSETRSTLDQAKTFYEQNAEVEVSERNRQLLGADFVELVSTAYEKEKDRGAGPIFSARMQDRTQARFEAIADAAFEARMREFGAWRRGVFGGATPIQNHLTHVFAHVGLFALLVSLGFFVFAGLTLEAAWGTLYFAGFCLLGTLLPGIAFRFLDADAGVPLAGASGLVSALLGALLVRAVFERKPVPGALLWPAWAVLEIGFVRGLGIDPLGTLPLATLGVGLVTGVGCAVAMHVLGLELQPAVAQTKVVAPAHHPALEIARSALEINDTTAAWTALSAAHAEAPRDEEVSLALWKIAIEQGRVSEVVEVIAPILQDRLRKGGIAEATAWWRVLVEHDCRAQLVPAALVKLAEGLLDEGHPDIALDALQQAIANPKRMPTALAQRVVRIARDLDPALTHRAAAIALADPQLEPETRIALEALADEVRAAIPRAPATAPVASPVEPTRTPITAQTMAQTTAQTTAQNSAATTAPEKVRQPEPTRSAFESIESDVSDIDLHHTADLTDPEQFAAENASLGANRSVTSPDEDRNALSISSLERELAGDLGFNDGEELSAPDPEGWNDPGMRPELVSEPVDASSPALFDRGGLPAEYVDNAHLEAGALSADSLAQAAVASPLAGSRTDTAPLAPLESGAARSPGVEARTQALGKVKLVAAIKEHPTDYPALPPLGARSLSSLDDDVAEPSRVVDPKPEPEADTSPITQLAAVVPEPAPPAGGLFGTEELETDLDLGPMRLRTLKLVVGVPIGAKARSLEVEVEGRGVSCVPFDRIEAVAVAAVAGLSEKPVLVIDLVLNWLADPEEPLKVVRIHSNRFDPLKLAPKAGSSVDALRRIVAGILKQSGATALPNPQAAAGSPFSRFADSASYEREVLGASV